jgi:hypothetical protein
MFLAPREGTRGVPPGPTSAETPFASYFDQGLKGSIEIQSLKHCGWAYKTVPAADDGISRMRLITT